MQQGKVIKCVGGMFTISVQDSLYTAYARKNVRYNNDNDNQTIIVGDNVNIEFVDNDCIITSVEPRLNQLIRPAVSNITNAIVMIAPKPTPDLLLVDKVLINCFCQHINPILVINKTDMASDEFINFINSEYSSVCDIVSISAFTGQGIDRLVELICNSTSCLVGQSAVGKTTLLNKLVPNLNKETGELSRNSRGRHTTRHSEIFVIGPDTYLVDTSGFSLLDIDIEPMQLMLYYPDLFAYSTDCEYNMCSHINEPHCSVRDAVDDGKLSEGRYYRYCQLYETLQMYKANQYK